MLRRGTPACCGCALGRCVRAAGAARRSLERPARAPSQTGAAFFCDIQLCLGCLEWLDCATAGHSGPHWFCITVCWTSSHRAKDWRRGRRGRGARNGRLVAWTATTAAGEVGSRPVRWGVGVILPRSGCRTRPRHQWSGSRQKSGRGGHGREAAGAAADDDEGLRSSAIFRYYSFFCLTVPQRQQQPTTTRAKALDHCRLSANAMPTTRRSGPADPSHFDPQGASPRRRRGVP